MWAHSGPICSSPGLRDNGAVADRLEGNNDHPVAYGLLALIGVGVVVGLIAGLGALAGARVVGVGEPRAPTTSSGGEASMYLPKPEPTKPATGPDITLRPGARTSAAEDAGARRSPRPAKKPKKAISLSAAQTAVAPMQQIDLTGVYPGGEGAILAGAAVRERQLGRLPRSPPVSVSDQTFTTYVQTGQPGRRSGSGCSTPAPARPPTRSRSRSRLTADAAVRRLRSSAAVQ